MGVKHRLHRSVLAAWIALLILAGACGSQAVSASEPILTQIPPTTAAEPTPQETLSGPTEVAGPVEEPGDPQDSPSPLVYANESYGFQLSFPTSWNGFSVAELDGVGVGSICFSFNRAMPVCVLQIDVYTHPQWSQLEKLNDDYYLGENGDYVFGAGPFTEACVQMDDFQCDRYHELPAILETFETE
jgi:hypothetical protein